MPQTLHIFISDDLTGETVIGIKEPIPPSGKVKTASNSLHDLISEPYLISRLIDDSRIVPSLIKELKDVKLHNAICTMCGVKIDTDSHRRKYCGFVKNKTGCAFKAYLLQNNAWKSKNPAKVKEYNLRFRDKNA